MLSALFAAAGSGSSGFGGGGGGGGGGFGGGAHGAGGGGSWVGTLAFVVLVVIVFAVITIVGAIRTRRYRARRAARAERIGAAAAEAVADDVDFAADRVTQEARELYLGVVKAWSDGDRAGLRERIGGDLLVEWERRLDDFERKGWHNICEVDRGPTVEYLGLVNRADDADDRVTVRVEARLHDYVTDRNGATIQRNNSSSQYVTQREWWTLGKREDRWILLSIEQDTEGAHHLDAPIVAAPWSDDQRLHDEAVTELAAADAVPTQQLAGVADVGYEGSARAHALDLAMVDGRFAPNVLEAAARRAVSAWAEAVDGEDAPLEKVATHQAVDALLYGGDASRRTRLVVRGPRLQALTIAAVDAESVPPSMVVEATIAGRRYREDRDTAARIEGSADREATFTERWTLTLDGDAQAPWRIAEAAAPVG